MRALVFLALSATFTTPAMAAANDDDWYDPSDWFDGNNLEYDDTYDYDYYDYEYDEFDYGYDWDFWDTAYDDYAWNDWNTLDSWGADYYDEAYWDDFEWHENYADLDSPGANVYSYNAWSTPSAAMQPTGRTETASANNKQQNQLSKLTGTIEGIDSVQLRRKSGATGTFTIAKVKLEDGKTTVVNLGRQSQLKDLNLKKGDTIKAIGRRGTIQGKTVFVAQKLEAGGKQIDANPVIRLKGEGVAEAGQPQQAKQAKQSAQSKQGGSAQQAQAQTTMKGEVARLERIKAGDNPAQHTLIQITLDNGRMETVDLGPGASVERIGLDEGDAITVRGHRDQINGRNVIVAELLRIDGEKVASVPR